ncbi:hypothetical protein KBC89_02190 [Candidatus Woesebacteria bacterium]|nr:hypothetical protein [Candidatus Woesebacteria bacterium]
MSFSLEGTGIPGPHMMRENRFPDKPKYQAIQQVVEPAKAAVLPPSEQISAGVILEPGVNKSE